MSLEDLHISPLSPEDCPGCKRAEKAKQTADSGLYSSSSSSKEVRVKDPNTGGEKGSKPECYEQIPVEPLAEIARVYNFGATKYARANFLKGYKWSLSTDALLRHIHQWRGGQSKDPESNLSHLAHAAFHLLALMEFELKKLGTDDRLYK